MKFKSCRVKFSNVPLEYGGICIVWLWKKWRVFDKKFYRDLEILEEIDEEKIAQLVDDEYREILQLAKN